MIAEQGISPLAAFRGMRAVMRTLLVTAVRQTLEYVPDLVVAHPKVLSAPFAARRLGIPHVMAAPTPVVTPTRAFPAPAFSFSIGPLNRATYVAAVAGRRMFAAELADAACTAGVEPVRRMPEADATLIPISEHLVPRPLDWPVNVQLTGPWIGRRSATPDPEVEAFMAGGPFLYAGLGSMAAGDPVARASTIVRAARDAGLRVLVATGWGGLVLPAASAGSDVLAVRTVDHVAVLLHAHVALHHGGAGTVHAVARAGVPSVVVPFLADQPFWAACSASARDRAIRDPPTTADDGTVAPRSRRGRRMRDAVRSRRPGDGGRGRDGPRAGPAGSPGPVTGYDAPV